MNHSGYLNFEHNLFERCQIGVITNVKYTLDDSGQVTDIFSGFVGVQLIQEAMRFDSVRWTNPAFGSFGSNNLCGIISIPKPNDVVMIAFDIQNRPFVIGAVWYDLMVKGINESKAIGAEKTDNRLRMKPGEIRIRGLKGNSLTMHNDGTMIYRVDDTKDDGSSPVITVDSNGNLSAVNIKDANVECQTAELKAAVSAKITTKTADIEADQANVISDDIHLGKTGAEAPVIRDTDKAQHIDPITGLPVFTNFYVTKSQTTKSK
jgi:membrane glycosyltransferase